jgi:hypothetical protein
MRVFRERIIYKKRRGVNQKIMISEANTILRFSGFDPRDIDTSRVWRSSVAICLVVLIVGSIGPVGKQLSGNGLRCETRINSRGANE